MNRSSATTEWIENNVALVATRGNYAIQKRQGLLGWVSQTLCGRRLYRRDICPDISDQRVLGFVQIQNARATVFKIWASVFPTG